MANTSKKASQKDADNTLRAAYNDSDASIAVSSFLAGKVGRKVALAISTTSIADDTETYTFTESGSTLYVLALVYTDGSRETLLTAERTS